MAVPILDDIQAALQVPATLRLALNTLPTPAVRSIASELFKYWPVPFEPIG